MLKELPQKEFGLPNKYAPRGTWEFPFNKAAARNAVSGPQRERHLCSKEGPPALSFFSCAIGLYVKIKAPPQKEIRDTHGFFVCLFPFWVPSNPFSNGYAFFCPRWQVAQPVLKGLPPGNVSRDWLSAMAAYEEQSVGEMQSALCLRGTFLEYASTGLHIVECPQTLAAQGGVAHIAFWVGPYTMLAW